MSKRILSSEDLEKAKNLSLDELEQGKDYTTASYFDEAHDYSYNHLGKLQKFKNERSKGAWSNHKRAIEEVPTLEDVIGLIRNIAKKDLKKAACCAILYLTGARIGEILGRTFKDNTVWEGIKWGDITSTEKETKEIVRIRTICEKRADNKFIIERNRKYQFIIKVIPIVIYNKPEGYKYLPDEIDYEPLIDIIRKYMESLPQPKDEDLIFPRLTIKGIGMYLNRHYRLSLHAFRHWRATHLIYLHNLTEAELRKILGWEKDSNMPTNYTHIPLDILEEKLSKKQKDSSFI